MYVVYILLTYDNGNQIRKKLLFYVRGKRKQMCFYFFLVTYCLIGGASYLL